MADFHEILQGLVDRDHDALLQIARSSMAACERAVAKYADEDKARRVVARFLRVVSASNGQCPPSERNLVSALLGEFEPAAEHADAAAFDELSKLIRKLGQEDKAAFVTLAASVCAADRTVDRQELALLAKLLD